jgi:hypothetical protein
MQSVIYAATRYGYGVQVIDGGEFVHEYTAGNCQQESQAVVALSSLNVVKLAQLRRWAKQTAGEIAQERNIPPCRVEYDAGLEATLREWDEEGLTVSGG